MPGPNLWKKNSRTRNGRRFNFLQGNTTELSPNNTPELNSSIIARQNAEKFQNRQIREREKEIRNIPKGIIKKRKSSLNFNFPETPPYTPPREDDFSCYLRPSFGSTPIQNQDDNDFLSYLQLLQHILEPQEPRETSFYFLMELNLKVCLHYEIS